MTETSLKVDKNERELEQHKQKIKEKIERKIGPIEIIESKNDLTQDETLSDFEPNSNQIIADTENNLTACETIPSYSVYSAINQRCNRSGEEH